MGDVLPFGTGAGDYSMNQPKLLADIGDVETEDSVTADTEPPAAGSAPPIDPNALHKAIDALVHKLRIAAQRTVTLLPPSAIPQEMKADLLTQYTTLESGVLELKARIVMASGSDENAAIAQDLEHIRLDVNSLIKAVEEQLIAAGVVKPNVNQPPSKRTALYVGLGITTVLVGGALIWAYNRMNDE
jgi:hypothetical protein